MASLSNWLLEGIEFNNNGLVSSALLSLEEEDTYVDYSDYDNGYAVYHVYYDYSNYGDYYDYSDYSDYSDYVPTTYGINIYSQDAGISNIHLNAQSGAAQVDVAYGNSYEATGFSGSSTYTATANSPAYAFDYWYYHLGSATATTQYSYSNPFTYSGSNNQSIWIAAASKTASYSLTLNTTGTGTGTVTGAGTYSYGTTVTVTATPGANCTFAGWSDGGAQSHTITITGNTTLTATFNLNTKHLTLNTSGSGTVTGAGDYTINTYATVGATPSTGWKFKEWSDSGAQSHQVYMDDDKTLTATFVEQIDLFNWINTITSGVPITNLTAQDWWNIQNKIDEVTGTAYSDWMRAISSTKSGGTYWFLNSAIFNQVRERIANLTGCGNITSSKSSSDRIMASYFNGDSSTSDSSIRAALNRAIEYWNTH